jgi:hypothetical protein
MRPWRDGIRSLHLNQRRTVNAFALPKSRIFSRSRNGKVAQKMPKQPLWRNFMKNLVAFPRSMRALTITEIAVRRTALT